MRELWWNSGELTVVAAMVMEGGRETRVRVLGDEDDDVAESDWLIW